MLATMCYVHFQKYESRQISPVATGAFRGLSHPKQSSKPPQIEI